MDRLDPDLCLPIAETANALLYATGARLVANEPVQIDAAFMETRDIKRLPGASRNPAIAVSLDARSGETTITRKPFGDTPCFWATNGPSVLASSDLDLLIAAGLPRPSIDPSRLARHLIAEDLRRNDTCLAGLDELRGGCELRLGNGGFRVNEIWSPWSFIQDEAQIADEALAVQRLKEVAIRSVSSMAKQAGLILLKLSGGLDSSLVAVCLKESGHPFLCLTLATNDPAGDERSYARASARAVEAKLVERFRVPAAVNLSRASAANLPRPSARAFTQESMRIVAEVSQEHGCDVVFDGGGGDNLFCSVQSARPAADCLMAAKGRPRFVQTVLAIAELAEASVWQVTSRAWHISRRTSPKYPWALDMRFLSADAALEGPAAASHPWLLAPSGTLPGKAAHLALIAAAQSVAEGFDPLDKIPTFSPLICQDMVETCLRIPSWMWFSRRGNRAIARSAFSELLPAEVAWRRSKGAPDSFIAELYECNRDLISSMLLDGALSKLGLIDQPALRTILGDMVPVRGHDYLRVMQLVDAEAWARNWI